MRGQIYIVAVAALLFGVVPNGNAQQQPQTQRTAQTTEATPATITRDQADAILNELREIRRLLETNGRPGAAPARPPQRPQTVRMAVSAGWYSLGREDAPVTLVEFLDYQCPYCRRFHAESFPELRKRYIDAGKLRFVARDLPLSFHANALSAAQAVRCAGEQGKFWELRESLILHSNDLTLDSILRYAEQAGIDAARLRTCVETEKYKATVQSDADEAAALSLSGTPSFVLARTTPQELSGDVIVGAVPLSVFDAAIKKLLDNPAPKTPATDPGAENRRPDPARRLRQ